MKKAMLIALIMFLFAGFGTDDLAVNAATDTCWDISQYLCCEPYNNQIWSQCGSTPCPPDYVDNTIASIKVVAPIGWGILELLRSLTDGECAVFRACATTRPVRRNASTAHCCSSGAVLVMRALAVLKR